MELLFDLNSRGVRLSRQKGRLVIDAPAGLLTDRDRRSLAAHKEELLAVADFGPDLALLVAWFRQARAACQLPNVPFLLSPGEQVTNPARFYTALEADIAAGPRGVRARLGGLGASLRYLRSVVQQIGIGLPINHGDPAENTART
jgi:hypothetical protein